MKENFRDYHLFQILNLYDEQTAPLDLFLRNYFKKNHAVGSKDRKIICESLYLMIRWRGLLDHLCEKPVNWKNRYHCLQHFSPHSHLNNLEIPPHVRASFPKAFFQLLELSLGPELAWEFCLASNETAPTTVRVNLLKISREELLAKWQPHYTVSPCAHSPTGIIFDKKENFFGMPEFKEGCFEVQDEASQLIADLVDPKPTDHVLDFCAGSGGKTLAFAPKMKGRGQIFLHDIRPHALAEAKKRLKRAGIQNAQPLLPDSPQKRKLQHTMDWVLVDAPCTGTGTLRRNPDMKWKFSPETVDRLSAEQKLIFKEALQFLRPGGYIVYATCSVLPQENEEQAAYFQEEFGLTPVAPPLKTFPKSGGMDGFFGIVFQKSPLQKRVLQDEGSLQ
jgi:16S rRNA C967 or C1407 C5-methylase (RsmB/RsmF family)